MENLTGKQLSRQYVLEERIGSGGMSDVYKAWDSARSIHMAVKVLHSELSSLHRTLDMFEAEAQFLKQLGHPNIARLYEFNRDQGYYYLVLEWIDGESLDKIIKRQSSPLSLNSVSSILFPISSALFYLHINNVLHCDIKPGNILINKNKKAFLADLGVARFVRGNETGGTPPYMAPEQFQKGVASTKTDIYALGVSVYEMLSGGVLPFRGESTHSQGSTVKERIAWEHINLPLPPITAFNKKIPDPVCRVLERALSKNPNERYSSAHDFYNAYEAARGNTSYTPPDNNSELKSTFLLPNLHSNKSDQSKPSGVGKNNSSYDNLWRPPLNFDRAYRKRERLIGLSGDWIKQIIIISQNQLSLGRSSQMQIRFNDRSVSRQHASLVRTRDGVIIKDERSTFGIFVNGVRIKNACKLDNGDVIQIGENTFLEFRDK